MKKAIHINIIMLVALSLFVLPGCGGNDNDENGMTSPNQEKSENISGMSLAQIEEDLPGTYKSIDDFIIEFLAENRLETNAFGERVSGDYFVTEQPFVYEISISFDDGTKEFLSVVAVDGKVRGVADDEGTHYIKQ